MSSLSRPTHTLSLSSNACLDDDPLTQLLGKDTRGSTRGVGPVSKGKVKAIEPLRSDFERVIHSNNMMQEVVYGLQTQLASYFGRHDKSPQVQSSQFSPRSNQFSGTPESSTIPIATPSPTPSPRPKQVVKLMDMSNKVIATGYIVPTPKGTIVHTRKMLEFESKVEVINVVPGEEETTVYLGSQGCATTMNEFMAYLAYVVFKGIRPGVYTSWHEAHAQVNGYRGALYRGFYSLELAEQTYHDYISSSDTFIV